jgi:predicted ATPase
MVSGTLRPTVEDLPGLVALIYSKTSGNPFFVWSFLGFLNEFHLLWFDEAHSRWQWRMDSNEEARLPATVVELFVFKLRRLDQDVRDLLCLAACLGNRFYLEPLSMVSGRDNDIFPRLR